ncbi:NfeD family protein [Paenibacillus senegalensis]|uniref:NfeD family protein n=1 Tax=Paenibacillus senegalensis TaxID=1465766 RepID=UPI000287A59E|nr:NfeD family protein [Paenibacillus senegalensis]
MLEFYWGCLIFGVLFALVTVLLGDLLSSAADGFLDFLSVDFLQPMVVAGAITIFGGAGILLTKYMPGVVGWLLVLIAIVIALAGAAMIYFFYVKPMNNSENSTGYSFQDLKGCLAEVITSIPENGYGEVIVKVGAGISNKPAKSIDKQPIPAGEQVVVVEVKQGVLLVSKYESLDSI